MTFGKEIQTADFPTLSYSRLLKRDTRELERLLDACKTHGFFYLDLMGQETEGFLELYQRLKDVSDIYFGQPLDVKMRDRKTDADGYEPCGNTSGAKEGSRDAYEALKVLTTFVLKESGREQLPHFVQDRFNLFSEFSLSARQITKSILACLSDMLGLTGSDRLEAKHDDDESSLSNLALAKYPKQKGMVGEGVGIQKHTDLGSLTLVLAEQWGLQVISPKDKGWRFVEPKPGHAVLNIGDSVRFLSGFQLKSAVHRVLPVGERQEEDRLSIIYFLRAGDNTEYKDSKGRLTTARQWHDVKYDVFRETVEQQAMDNICTGGMEKNNMIIV